MGHAAYTRRDILRLGLFAGAAGFSSALLPHRLRAAAIASGRPDWDGTLVMLKLDGGNDGLNTVIPFKDPLYQSARPSLAVAKADQIPVSGTLAFNRALEPLMQAWSEKDMLVALGVGYPDMQGMDSHFLSSDIWATAVPVFNTPTEGWIARYLDAIGGANRPVSAPADAAMMGGGGAESLGGTTIRTVYNPGHPPRINTLGSIAARARQNPVYGWMVEEQGLIDGMAAGIPNVSAVTLKNPFPATGIGKDLASVSRLIVGGSRIPIMSVHHGSYDTHVSQHVIQGRLLAELAGALAVFRKEMIEQGRWDKVLVMTHAEFGRSMYENSTLGTDHGKANCHFILGGRVRGGGFIGGQAPLSSVSNDVFGIRAPEYQLDFRRIYATLMQDWWRGPERASDAVLRGAFKPIPFLKA